MLTDGWTKNWTPIPHPAKAGGTKMFPVDYKHAFSGWVNLGK